MLNNVRLSKLEIKKRLLEKLNTISGNQAEQESQIMISYSAKKENYLELLKLIPNVNDGLHIMKFIKASVDSSNKNSNWVDLSTIK